MYRVVTTISKEGKPLYFQALCSSRKYPYSTHRKDWNIQGGGGGGGVRGSVIQKKFKEMCILIEISRRVGGSSIGEAWVFSVREIKILTGDCNTGLFALKTILYTH